MEEVTASLAFLGRRQDKLNSADAASPELSESIRAVDDRKSREGGAYFGRCDANLTLLSFKVSAVDKLTPPRLPAESDLSLKCAHKLAQKGQANVRLFAAIRIKTQETE